MIESKDITAVGKFQKTHALKGELNAILEIDPVFFEEGNAVIVDIDGIYVPFFTSGIRPKGSTSYLIKLDGIDSEEEARGFVNKTLFAKKEELGEFFEMEPDEILDDDDMIGYRLIDNESGIPIGTVVHIDTATDNVLFIVETPAGDEIFVPAVDEFINEVDDAEKIMRVTLPEGLVSLNSKES
jgi:16S rRNA processing protein RimM